MEGSKKKKQVYKSMKEFEEKFFPKSFRKKSTEFPSDARALGIRSARESLSTVRRQLSK
ncbi:MAG: hypothetical protein KAW56_17755 [Candidatus Marinimicrobia bacterium]|nr:hypothetical protein [Candidatus Neomarinimicrobiota bacterium]MCK4448914.1 hypothetical protein [Candidatus Neomarinimicrobiota bacterium]